MAYVAMNMNDWQILRSRYFLNGVCRHEQEAAQHADQPQFLNGVCRHELLPNHATWPDGFLNGVCRHELLNIAFAEL